MGTFTDKLGSLVDDGQKWLFDGGGLSQILDRETSQTETVIVRDPTPTVTVSDGNKNGTSQTFDAGASAQMPTAEIMGMPWHQALLLGSVGLLAVGVGLKLVMR